MGEVSAPAKGSVARSAMPFVCFILLLGCTTNKLEKDFFFKNPPATRIDRLRQYSLDDQYRLFRHGNDKFEPPILGLAEPMAEKGKEVIPFLLGKLSPPADDITVRDVLLVFETMSRIKSYDLKSDEFVITTLRSRVSTMKDGESRTVSVHILQRMEGN